VRSLLDERRDSDWAVEAELADRPLDQLLGPPVGPDPIQSALKPRPSVTFLSVNIVKSGTPIDFPS
jgi:hypothetical protein